MNNQKVWGWADEFELNFVQNDKGTWSVQVPLDTKDGTYFVSIAMQNNAGVVGWYDGFLYVFNGRFRLEVERSPVQFEMLKDDVSFEIERGVEFVLQR